MRISELATRSGVPLATVKYYLREGLLPPGTATAATQATYDDVHVERLRLIRVLREVGQVPVAAIGGVLAAIDDPHLPLHDIIATAHHALGPPTPPPSDAHTRARADVDAYLAARGWRLKPEAPAIDALAGALVALRALLGDECGPDAFGAYADVAEELARKELASVDPTSGTGATIAQVVVGTVVFEHALVALRRLAEEHHSAMRFGPAAPNGR